MKKMTREEAIKELEEDKALYMPKEWMENIDRDTPDGRLITALDMAIQVLEQATWIPASERLPKEGEDVLACFYTSEGNYKMMVSRRSDYNYWDGVGRTADTVAWMPLPKPYKVESEVEK